MSKDKILKILEDNKITNFNTPADQMISEKVEEQPTDDIVKNIKWVLEKKVAPAVAQHDGKIEYISFKANPPPTTTPSSNAHLTAFTASSYLSNALLTIKAF